MKLNPQATETTEASQYGPRPQFNKTPKYVKYRDAGTGIREYNDGTFDMKRDQDSTSQVKQMHTT